MTVQCNCAKQPFSMSDEHIDSIAWIMRLYNKVLHIKVS